MRRPVVLFVLGMGRSGSSALTRVLSLCGGALPDKLMGANEGNPRGYWEPSKAVYLNDLVMDRYGSNWADPSLCLQEEGAFGVEANAAAMAEIRAFLARLPTAPLVVIKDPRLSLLSALWFEAARQAGFDIAAVIPVRHPNEVVQSSLASLGTSPELASALWLKYTLLAERDTRTVPRVFVEYTNLLGDWRREITRISAALSVDLSAADEGAIDEFLTADLRRQRHDGPVTDPFGAGWTAAIYKALLAAAQDEPWDESELDHVFETYRASERGFRVASENFRDHFCGVLSRPQVHRAYQRALASPYVNGILNHTSTKKVLQTIRRK